jgi:hypothetical protein
VAPAERPPQRADHNRVEPGDAIGIGLRIPEARLHVLVDLLSPAVDPELILVQRDFVTAYATVGRDTLNGRSVPHRWVNVIGDPPPGVEPEDGIGGIACIGAPSSPIYRMWRRAGLAVVAGRLSLALDQTRRTVNVRISTRGGTLTTVARYEAGGEPWSFLPQRYYLTDPRRQVLYTGDEWGTAHAGAGVVEFTGDRGTEVFEVVASVDLDLGWDYTLTPQAAAPARDGGRHSP